MTTLDEILQTVRNLANTVSPMAREWPAMRREQRDRFKETVTDHGKRISQVETRLNGNYRPPRTSPVEHVDHFDPDKTPHGSIRLDPEMWERFAYKFKEQEDKRLGAEEYAAELKKQQESNLRHWNRRLRNLRTVLTCVSAAVPIVGWLVHVLHW